MKYKVVIFDLDGTLIDSLEDLGWSRNLAIKFGMAKDYLLISPQRSFSSMVFTHWF